MREMREKIAECYEYNEGIEVTDQVLSHIREWGDERCTEHPEIFIGINYFFGNKIYIKPRRRECDQCWKELGK